MKNQEISQDTIKSRAQFQKITNLQKCVRGKLKIRLPKITKRCPKLVKLIYIYSILQLPKNYKNALKCKIGFVLNRAGTDLQ